MPLSSCSPCSAPEPDRVVVIAHPAPAQLRGPDARAADGPHVLFFSKDGPVPDIYREQLPDGWRFSALEEDSTEQHKLGLLADADVIIHTDTPVTRRHVAAAPHLALVQRQGVGVDALDVPALRESGIAVAICPDGTAEAVAEHTVMLMLAAGRHLIRLHEDITSRGRWPKWEYRHRSLGLHDSTIGIVGFGRIGQAVAQRVLAFGSSVLVHRRRDGPVGPEWADRDVRTCPDLDELFTRSDVVTLHCPLLPENRGMVDSRRLAVMKPDSVFVNTARGGLVVEPDLVSALRAGRPAAAGLDVFTEEPPASDNPLFTLPNVVLTPHCGAGTRQTHVVKARSIFGNIARLWSGQELENRLL